jgi:hypothetical protein
MNLIGRLCESHISPIGEVLVKYMNPLGKYVDPTGDIHVHVCESQVMYIKTN